MKWRRQMSQDEFQKSFDPSLENIVHQMAGYINADINSRVTSGGGLRHGTQLSGFIRLRAPLTREELAVVRCHAKNWVDDIELRRSKLQFDVGDIVQNMSDVGYVTVNLHYKLDASAETPATNE